MPKPSAATSNDNPERQLMIKTKVCQRYVPVVDSLSDVLITILTAVSPKLNPSQSLIKELEFYKEELHINEKQLEAMKQDFSKDRYDVQRFQDIVNESLRMVPDATKRLQVAVDDLSYYVATFTMELDSKGSWFETAQQILASNEVPRSEALGGGIEATDTSDLKEGEAF
jgi:Tubulin binding cofactor A